MDVDVIALRAFVESPSMDESAELLERIASEVSSVTDTLLVTRDNAGAVEFARSFVAANVWGEARESWPEWVGALEESEQRELLEGVREARERWSEARSQRELIRPAWQLVLLMNAFLPRAYLAIARARSETTRDVALAQARGLIALYGSKPV